MTDIVIAAYRRSPFHFAAKGHYTRVRPDDLAAEVVRALVAESGIDPEGIEDVIVGCAFPEGEQGLNVARLISFIAGLPRAAAGVTVNRFCGSSMQAIHQAAGAIALGAGEAFLCAGVESMTRVPMGGYNLMPNPALAKDYPQAYISMGETAENVAQRYQVSRADQEAFAVESQRKAATARAEGRLADEIVPIGKVAEDGCIRTDTSAGKTGHAEAGFPGGWHGDGRHLQPADRRRRGGAGLHLGLCEGQPAAIAGPDKIDRGCGLPAGNDGHGAGGGHAQGPGPRRHHRGRPRRDRDQRGFRQSGIACMRELGLDPARTNIDGGGIAIGHPLGATGARITGKAASLLRRGGGRYALATQCIGGGQGIATVLEAVTMIKRVGVIGAGVMGAGIAAHVANAGVPVVLLDIVPGAAARAVETMLKADPAPFMHFRNARLVEAR